jgi:hypothetical protein
MAKVAETCSEDVSDTQTYLVIFSIISSTQDLTAKPVIKVGGCVPAVILDKEQPI